MTATTAPASASPRSKGGRHGNEGDGVDPHAAGQKIAHHRDQQAHDDGQRAGRPHPVRQLVSAGKRRGEAKGEPRQRDRDQGPPCHAFCHHCRPIMLQNSFAMQR